MSMGSFFLNKGHIQPIVKDVLSSTPCSCMSWKSSVSALIMLKLGTFLCHRLLCRFSRAFYSSYGQPSRPVAVLSFVHCNALLTCSSVIFQFIIVLSGSSRCWFAGILFRILLIIISYSSIFMFGSMSSFWRALWWLQVLRSKGLKVRRARVVLRRKWSQGTGTLNDIGSALKSLPKTNVLE